MWKKEDYYKPILIAINEGCVVKQTILNRVRVLLNISDEEMLVRTKSRTEGEEGKRIKVVSDLDNAIYSLGQMGLIDYDKTYSLTKEGERYVSVQKQTGGTELKNSPSGDRLENLITTIRDDIQLYSFSYISNEATVRAEIIDPIFREIGWHVPYIEREVSYSGSYKRNRVDYALRQSDEYRMIIEAKSLETKIESFECRQQILTYLNSEKFKGCLGILTNGYQWICYDEGEIIIKTTIESEKFVEFLRLFSFDNLDISRVRRFNLLDEGSFDIDQKKFNVIYIDEPDCSICGKNPTDTLGDLIERYCEEIYDLQEKQLIDKKYVSIDSSVHRNKKAVKHHRVRRNGKTYYYTRDYSTVIKRMIAHKILYYLDINAYIENQKES